MIATAKQYGQEETMMDKQIRNAPDYIQPYFGELSQYQRYYEYEKSIRLRRDIDDKFICLKGFSSSTPIINSATFGRECLGGGFYFRFGGHGIAIDPGIGFTSLMHRNGVFIDDIDTVIVTHPHLDHNCDVNVLSALKHDYNKNRNKGRSFLDKFFECTRDEPHKIAWYMDEETIAATQSVLKDDEIHALSECCDGKVVKLGENIGLRAVKTKHIKDNDRTYGIKLCFNSGTGKRIWGYTSDTCFFDGLGQFFLDSSILVFNISDIYLSDVEGRKNKHSHLGFDGSLKLLQSVMPRVALASEFCCTNGDYRYEIVKALREYSDVLVFPSDPGLVMNVEDSFVRCSLCGKDVLAEQIRILRPDKEYGTIRYICSDCLI